MTYQDVHLCQPILQSCNQGGYDCAYKTSLRVQLDIEKTRVEGIQSSEGIHLEGWQEAQDQAEYLPGQESTCHWLCVSRRHL